MKASDSPAVLARKCSSLGMNDAVSNSIVSAWSNRSSELVSVILARTVSANRLIDMDWSFGVTAASDYSNQVGKTYLQLKLSISGENGITDEYFELSLEQFYAFLAQMEKCKAYLDLISG